VVAYLREHQPHARDEGCTGEIELALIVKEHLEKGISRRENQHKNGVMETGNCRRTPSGPTFGFLTTTIQKKL